MTALSRRKFLTVSALAGGGMMIGVRVPLAATAKAAATASAPVSDGQLLAWIKISPDETVTMAIPTQEIGQGSGTAQAMLIADELDVDWGKVVTHPAVADKKYGPQGAGGSQTIIQTFKSLRTAGATGRAMLVAAAAARWKVPAGECATEPGAVVHAASGRRLSYGALAADAAILTPPQSVELKPKAEWRYIGKPVRKRETPNVVVGKQVYGMDMHLPDMLVASMEHTPTPGAKPRYEAANAMKVNGVVKIVELAADPALQVRGGVVVIARDTWAAFKGRDALAIVWDEPNAVDSTNGLGKQLAETAQKPGDSFSKKGDLDAAMKTPDLVTIRADYEEPFLAHMVMEPQNCVVQFKDGKAMAWGPTQNAQGASAAIAKALKLDEANVVFQPLAAGGGFGRRGNTDAAAEAALIAAQTGGLPVKLVWKREDETRFDMYRPMSHATVEVSATKDGNLVGWRHHLVSTLGRPDTRALGDGLLYEVPNTRFDYTPVKIATTTGAWRGVDYVYNVFAVESAMDEIAVALGQDPFEFRMRYLTKTSVPKRVLPQPFGREPVEIDYARMRAVLGAVGKSIGWNQKPAPGRGMGVAAYTYAASHCAVACEVGITDKGAVKVLRMSAAMDAGTHVNPLSIQAQIQGGLIMGLSAALREQITLKAGKAQQSTYSDYRLIRMPDVPKIDVVLIESGGAPSGIGEIAVPGIAPALANAVFAATGERIRSLPLFHAKPSLEPRLVA